MTNTRKRLFFALWPDQICRKQLIERTNPLIEKSQGRVVRPENLHMTLAFLHSVDSDLIPCITAAANRVENAPFNLELARVGCWTRSRILWLAPPEPDNELPDRPGELADALWQELSVCGFEAEQRCFRPHVTLARKTSVSTGCALAEPVSWSVNDFVLAESVTGRSQAEYVVLQRFPLFQNHDNSQ